MHSTHTNYRFSSLANASQRSEIRELLMRSQTPGLITVTSGSQQGIDLLAYALEQGLAFVPGAAFYAGKPDQRT